MRYIYEYNLNAFVISFIGPQILLIILLIGIIDKNSIKNIYFIFK